MICRRSLSSESNQKTKGIIMKLYKILAIFLISIVITTIINARDNEIALSLMEASANGKTKIVKALIAGGADVNAKTQFGSALISASSMGHSEIVNILIDNGADVNIRNNKGLSSLMLARDTKTVRTLINRGADVNAKDNEGFTALIYASGLGYAEIVKILIANGADVTAKTISTNPYFNGITALKQAKRANQKAVVKILKQAGAKE